jgi:phosphoribosyl 1,2-cyclic phosphate phosphodiesterase
LEVVIALIFYRCLVWSFTPTRRACFLDESQNTHLNDDQGELVFLGTGTSVGVPVLGCKCEVCRGGKPKNQRTRSSVLFRLPSGNLLVDTSPELRLQLLAQGIDRVDAVMFTHEHADHLHGMDDLRLFPFQLGHPVPVYCAEKVETRIRRIFDYAFSDRPETHPGSVPKLELRRITETEPFIALGQRVQPIPLRHGVKFDVLGFRIGSLAYCTDMTEVYESGLPHLQGLDVLIVGALRATPHPTHLSVDGAIELVRKLKPKRAYLTHTSHELDYDFTNDYLPPNIRMAYDGLRIPFSLWPANSSDSIAP